MCVLTHEGFVTRASIGSGQGGGEGVGQVGATVPPHPVSPAVPLGQPQLQGRGSHLCTAGSRKSLLLMLGKFLSLQLKGF